MTEVQVRVRGNEVIQVRAVEQIVSLRTLGQGPPGVAGPSGLQKINHGTDANHARSNAQYPDGLPAGTIAFWVGTVAPLNAGEYDLWYLS